MKKASLLILVIATSFCFGFAFKTIISREPGKQATIKKVTSIGGIFFKCKDPGKMKQWYHENLGLNTNDFGATFNWF